MLMQSGIDFSWGEERGSQVQDIVFPEMLLVLPWEGQATSQWVCKQRESHFGWSENPRSHLDRSLVLINSVNILPVSFQLHSV